MAVKIRLKRIGAKKNPFYRIVVADARYPRDGRFIEQIGTYNPMVHPAIISIDGGRALSWMKNGAQPTDTVRSLFKRTGALEKAREEADAYDAHNQAAGGQAAVQGSAAAVSAVAVAAAAVSAADMAADLAGDTAAGTSTAATEIETADAAGADVADTVVSKTESDDIADAKADIDAGVTIGAQPDDAEAEYDRPGEDDAGSDLAAAEDIIPADAYAADGGE
jgi:small subunit ribosomal protein S16